MAVCRAMRPRAEGMPVSLPSRNRIKSMKKSYRMRPQIVNEIRRRRAILGESSAKFSLLRKENEAPLRARITIDPLVFVASSKVMLRFL